ncbi:twin-arginine translocation signal domain-containing protein [Halogeometricum borinquense]|uniref:Twin-arginine translocation signal domain-containing protein n=1 Tax=Halogeometricum borinquense TaxID=60847 RepID=A0A482TKT7_9EURY|nr:twin-arginine translocation signal domain-containing protein [Halogeometricum borinquense]RYJ14573.1 twin-arginine translocation signal domain-containing protein [Halogeometricum borinquense]
MSEDNSSISRRKILKATGAAAASGALGVPAVSAQSTEGASNGLPDGTRVFMGNNVTFDQDTVSTAKIESSGLEKTSLSNSDLVLVSPKTDLARGKLTTALKKGRPIVTVGKQAFDGLLSIVYGLDHDNVEKALKNGRAKEAIDLPYSFGFEYSDVHESTVAFMVPANGVLNTFRLRSNSTSLQTVLSYLGERLKSKDNLAVSTQATDTDSNLVVAADICPPGSTGGDEAWNCLGSDALTVSSPCPYGGWDRTSWGAKLKETDGNNDWWAWETKLEIRPSSNVDNNCSSDAWHNDFMTRSITFNDGKVKEYGPPTDKNDYSSSKSVGFGLTAGFESVQGSATLEFSESKSRSGVTVDSYSGDKDAQVDYDISIKRGGNVSGEEFIAYLGQRHQTKNNLSSTDYAYDDTWRWYDPNLIGTETHEETDYGTAYWSV